MEIPASSVFVALLLKVLFWGGVISYIDRSAKSSEAATIETFELSDVETTLMKSCVSDLEGRSLSVKDPRNPDPYGTGAKYVPTLWACGCTASRIGEKFSSHEWRIVDIALPAALREIPSSVDLDPLAQFRSEDVEKKSNVIQKKTHRGRTAEAIYNALEGCMMSYEKTS